MYFKYLSTLFVTTTCLMLSSPSAAQLPGSWPTADVVPPTRPEWTALVNVSALPNAPIQTKAGGNCAQATQFCYWSCNTCTRPDDAVACPTQKDWGITYDDGPSPNTPGILDYLDKTKQKVTFFVVGSRVIERPEILQREFKSGHEIGLHTWSHPYLTTLTNEQIIAEIKWTELAIKTAIGVTPTYMRPPYGDIDDRVRGIMTQLGYKVVIWDKDSTDYLSDNNPKYNPATITNFFSTWVKEASTTGHISLEHDLYPVAAQMAPKALDIVMGDGFHVKPVGQCFGIKAFSNSTNATTTASSATTTPVTSSSDTPATTPSSQSTPSSQIASTSSSSTLPFSSLALVISFAFTMFIV